MLLVDMKKTKKKERKKEKYSVTSKDAENLFVIGIILYFIFDSLFVSRERSWYFLNFQFVFTLWSAGKVTLSIQLLIFSLVLNNSIKPF